MRKNEPEPPIECPDMPDWLSEVAQQQWERLTPLLMQQGLLTQLDQIMLAILCQAYSDYLEASKLCKNLIIKTTNGNLIQNPAIGIKNTAQKILQRAAAEFGMTPSGRASITVTGIVKKSTDEASRFFSRIG